MVSRGGGGGGDGGHGGDPVLARRARVAGLAAAGRRVGYGLLVVAMAAFATGAVTGFTTLVTTTVTAALVGATLSLPPSLVAGYAVKAAEREDRRSGR